MEEMHEHVKFVRIDDVWNAYWRATELLKEKRMHYLVGTSDQDELSRTFEEGIDIIKNEILDHQNEQNDSKVWRLFNFLFPDNNNSAELLSRWYNRIEKLCENLQRTSSGRDRALATLGFQNEYSFPLYRNITTVVENVVMDLGLHIAPDVKQSSDRIQFEDPLDVPDSAYDWWEEAVIYEEPPDFEPDRSDVQVHLKRAARKLVEMMDITTLFPKSRYRDAVWETLDAAKKEVLLLTKFHAIPDTASIISEQLEKLIPILYRLYMHIHWIKTQLSLIRYPLYIFLPNPTYNPNGFLNSIRGAYVLKLTKLLNTLIAESLDRRREHYQSLLRSKPQISSVEGLGTSASERFTDEIFRLLPEKNEGQEESIQFILTDQISRQSEFSDQPQHYEDEDENTLHDRITKEILSLNLQFVTLSLNRSRIGRGAYGEVYQARKINDGYDVVIKVPTRNSSKSDKNLLQYFWREVRNWNEIQMTSERIGGNFFLPLLGFSYLQGHQYPGLVSPYLPDGNLHDYIENNTPELLVRLKLLIDVARAVNFLHTEMLMVHADLRAANILIEPSGHAVLCDFGLSVKLPDFTNVDRRTSREWLAPELVKTDGLRIPRVDRQTDIWAFGCVCVEVLIGRVPSVEEQNAVILAEVEGRPRKPIRGIQPAHWNLIADCWKIKPETRPGMRSIIRDLEELIKVHRSSSI